MKQRNRKNHKGIRYDIGKDLNKVMELATPIEDLEPTVIERPATATTTTARPTNEALTQVEIIKAHLKAGKTISTIEAFTLYRITALAQRIHDLRTKHGLIIDAIPMTLNGKRYVSYKWNELNDKRVTAGEGK